MVFNPELGEGCGSPVSRTSGKVLTNDSDSSETASGYCGVGLTWTYDTETCALTIAGKGAMWDFSCSDTKWGGNEIKSVSLPDGLTSVGSCAFSGCTSLTSVTIPDSVTFIREYAFNGCISLTSVTIPDSVMSIGDGAFSGCASLASVTIPDSVTSIGNGAFSGCTSLTAIVVGEGNKAYASENGVLFNKTKTTLIQYPVGKTDSTYTIPDSITSIGNSTFNGCTSLTAIVVGEGNKAYASENGVLFNKTKTTLIQYPVGKTDSIYVIPDSVTDIKYYAFNGCTSLASVTIPDSIKSIGEYAFNGCTSLTAFVVGEGNKAYTSENGVLFNRSKTTLIQYPAGKTDSIYVIPDSITSIGGYAFEGCTSLASVTIHYSVKSIGEYAFNGCTSLTAFVVGNGNRNYTSNNGVLFDRIRTTLIQYPAGKTDSTYTIPDSVTSIKRGAFLGANNLESIGVSETNTDYSSSSGCLLNKGGPILFVCPAGKKSASVSAGVGLIVSGAFSGDRLEEVVFSDSASVDLDKASFYNCTALGKIVIEDGANVVFKIDSIRYTDMCKHTIYVVAPEGYEIPHYALDGDVEIIYGEPPSDSDD